jgi:2-methylaconitate cis-trans-isomerase PrpF
VDTKPNCGNMVVAVDSFAIEAGMVPACDGETRVRIFNVNTQSMVEAIVPGIAVPRAKRRPSRRSVVSGS